MEVYSSEQCSRSNAGTSGRSHQPESAGHSIAIRPPVSSIFTARRLASLTFSWISFDVDGGFLQRLAHDDEYSCAAMVCNLRTANQSTHLPLVVTLTVGSTGQLVLS